MFELYSYTARAWWDDASRLVSLNQIVGAFCAFPSHRRQMVWIRPFTTGSTGIASTGCDGWGRRREADSLVCAMPML